MRVFTLPIVGFFYGYPLGLGLITIPSGEELSSRVSDNTTKAPNLKASIGGHDQTFGFKMVLWNQPHIFSKQMVGAKAWEKETSKNVENVLNDVKIGKAELPAEDADVKPKVVSEDIPPENVQASGRVFQTSK
ncbi:uncharacterized protein [Cicer arietinum]|uniref:uncharacterized protein n=1 Tax=Cicer arietinum TaxID=3827 RepID=UPI003CC64411